MRPLRLPHFIIAGAPRTATTWLYELAARHPAVAMAGPVSPEPKFFLVDDRYERGLAYYAATWFDRLPADRCYGEKSTNYLESITACERIALDLPTVRLIFLLRDPIERAYSNYLWSVRNGMETESFGRALELEESRERNAPPELRFARPHAYFSRGLYARLLSPWFERFPREHILVLHTEDVSRAAGSVARAFFEFVGVPARPDLATGLAKVNSARPDGAPAIEPAVYESLRERYRGPQAELAALIGSPAIGPDASA